MAGATLAGMLAIARFRIPRNDAVDFRNELEQVKGVLSAAAGFISGSIGQNLDDPTLWVLTTEWENVGSYRRALSSTRAKLEAIPILAARSMSPERTSKIFSLTLATTVAFADSQPDGEDSGR